MTESGRELKFGIWTRQNNMNWDLHKINWEDTLENYPCLATVSFF